MQSDVGINLLIGCRTFHLVPRWRNELLMLEPSDITRRVNHGPDRKPFIVHKAGYLPRV